MKKIITIILVGLLGSMCLPVMAESRGINIHFVNEGKGTDVYALQATRKIIGTAIAEGHIDHFNIGPLKSSIATPKQGGYTACIEAGIITTSQTIDALIKRLKFIHPKRGTTISVENTASCQKPVEVVMPAIAPIIKPVPVACGGAMNTLCPDNRICVDDPSDGCDPILGGKNCAGICN